MRPRLGGLADRRAMQTVDCHDATRTGGRGFRNETRKCARVTQSPLPEERQAAPSPALPHAPSGAPPPGEAAGAEPTARQRAVAVRDSGSTRKCRWTWGMRPQQRWRFRVPGAAVPGPPLSSGGGAGRSGNAGPPTRSRCSRARCRLPQPASSPTRRTGRARRRQACRMPQ
jgi:hypothetical protein